MESIKNILVVDDEPDAIEFVKAVLSDIKNLNILSAKDGNECLSMAVSQKLDLIILDVIMPGMDGFLVFHELRNTNETKDIPVIMLTGVADKVGIKFIKEDMKKYTGNEPVDYIEKPLDPIVLQNAVKKALEL